MAATAIALLQQVPESFLTAESQFQHTFEVEVDSLERDPCQPRERFCEEEIANLAMTMAEHGQLQPVLVRRNLDQRDRWIIVAGERRWRAAKANGWKKMLAIEHRGDHEIAMLVENLQRVDLSPVEEARGLQRLIADKGLSQVEAGALVGKHQSNVSATLGVLTLPDDFLNGYVNSHFQVARGALIELARLEPGPVQDRLIALARAGESTIPMIRAERKKPDAKANAEGSARRARGSRLPPFSLKAAKKLRSSIQEVRAEHRIIDPAEKAELEELVREIKAWLDQSDQFVAE